MRTVQHLLDAKPADVHSIGPDAPVIDALRLMSERHIGAVHLQDAEQPVRQFQVAIAYALGLAERLHETVIADAVQFAGDGFEADVGHVLVPLLMCFRQFAAHLRGAFGGMESAILEQFGIRGPGIAAHPCRPAETAK